MVFSERISLRTNGFGDVTDLTPRVAEAVRNSGMQEGLATVFCPGSTGAVTTIEFESGVVRDLQKALERLVPANIAYEHDRRWEDGNGFAHVRAALMKPSLTVPVMAGHLSLGTWQQIVFIDFDNRRRDRSLIIQLLGE